MKIIGVRDFRKDAREMYEYVDCRVEAGVLWWKKREFRTAYRNKHSTYWRWADTGNFTPRWEVENLVDAYLAKKEMP